MIIEMAQDSGERASVALRRALLDHLGLPPGQAAVTRRRTAAGETLVVRLVPGARPASRPEAFGGLPVTYESARPPRAGRW
ncbi:hypothetical protein VQ03_03765 [Methylobacterium tarhaniae]|uniref:Uncharacterized protein n=1 Tax=Methylobacterium tarhaniae TaxID=1187852 RepID=A0A0J6TEP8_9HYPH|nr:hypothetical protein [Methylobacterium tarhaniae]KMO44384.1 hypothetical protein VQ03_03765 [Methylobacterium tarhaniae]